MRALSVRQPWAWLIVQGHKPVENRTWGTRVRGEILIHAAQRFDYDGYFWVRENFPEIPLPSLFAGFDRGGIVGAAHLVDCVENHPSRFFSGPFGLVLEEARPLPFQPCKGKLGFFSVDSPTPGRAGKE